MKKYAKLVDGCLERLRRIPNNYSCTEEYLAQYAKDNGYKELVESAQPSPHYTPLYSETDTTIEEGWEPMDLDMVKQEAYRNIQESLSYRVKQRTEVTCEALEGSIIYDEDALINAMGLEPGDAFILADDSIVQVTEDQIAAIKGTLKGYRQGIYAEATLKRQEVADAKTVEEVEKVVF